MLYILGLLPATLIAAALYEVFYRKKFIKPKAV